MYKIRYSQILYKTRMNEKNAVVVNIKNAQEQKLTEEKLLVFVMSDR